MANESSGTVTDITGDFVKTKLLQEVMNDSNANALFNNMITSWYKNRTIFIYF